MWNLNLHSGLTREGSQHHRLVSCQANFEGSFPNRISDSSSWMFNRSPSSLAVMVLVALDLITQKPLAPSPVKSPGLVTEHAPLLRGKQHNGE